MDPFVRRLVERILDESRPLSRNRHFHTFDNPLGKKALKTSRVLQALARDVVECRKSGGQPKATVVGEEVRLELKQPKVRSQRTTRLERAEYELLCGLPGVREAFR